MTTAVDLGVGQDLVHGRGCGEPERSGPGHVPGPLRDWLALLQVLAGRVYRALFFTLVAAAVLPALAGWTGYLVRSGSMEPSIAAGDVVVGRPFSADEKVPVGRVMVFSAPVGSAAESGLLVHRVMERHPDGGYTTRGDANATNDASPVSRDRFHARAILRVPYVGLPLVWLFDGRYALLALWLLATVVLLTWSFRPLDGDRRRGGGGPRRWLRRLHPSRRPPSRRSRVALRTTAVAATFGVLVVVPVSASAAFTAKTTSGSNTWKAAANLEQRYTTAVMADAPWAFYRVDEPSGTNADDATGNARTGTYVSVAAYGQTGALPNNPGYAVRFAANSGRMVAGGTSTTNPTTFSVELWFRTTTTSGGKLFGFESTRNANSNTGDRTLLMRTDGRLAYVAGSASNASRLTTTAAYNDGAWHHVVVAAVPGSLGLSSDVDLYVDGVRVATGSITNGSSYAGWWRVGYGRVPTATGYPSTGNFTGTVDDVAIYRTELSATRVAAHHSAR